MGTSTALAFCRCPMSYETLYALTSFCVKCIIITLTLKIRSYTIAILYNPFSFPGIICDE
jgi:hypothetical protein